MEAVEDDYFQTRIKSGDLGSKILAEEFAPTLKFSRLVRSIVEGMNNIAVLDVPSRNECVVHSRGGIPGITDLFEYGRSVVEMLVSDAKKVGAVPIGLADIIEVPDFNPDELRKVARGIKAGAEDYRLPVLNGEYAIHGYRVNTRANVSATMISMRDKTPGKERGTFTWNSGGHGTIVYAFFDPKGRPVFINSDGVGTKTELYELARLHHLAFEDFMAMTMDDAAKIGALVQVISGVVETSGDIPFEQISAYANSRTEALKILNAMQREDVGNRIHGYKLGMPTYNIAGSVVSVIDEARLRSLPKPEVGDRIIAVVGLPNVRSNGITSRRKDLREFFGEKGYSDGAGKEILEYLTRPSILFYPFATEAINTGQASGFFHMSGGAYDGKFARPLAKHKLLGEIDRPLALRDSREAFFIQRAGADPETCYKKYPMNYDAFVTAKDFSAIESLAARHGLTAIDFGSVKAPGTDGRTGLALLSWNGRDIYLQGK